jgi:transcriptional regulator with XRE-family HTH domain
VAQPEPVWQVLNGPTAEATTLGGRLRRLRRMRQMTLEEVATEVGISPSFLSMVERGQADISLSRFARLAGFYGIRPSELMLEDPNRHVPAVGHVKDGLSIDRGQGITYRLLPNSPSGLQVIHIVFGPRSAMRDVLAHDGEDFCFVVEGSLVLLYGDREVVLGKSQCVTYAAAIPHAFRNDTDATAELMALTTKPYW